MAFLQSIPDAWVAGLTGGLLIGVGAFSLLWLIGRIAGISGIVGGLLAGAPASDRAWRLASAVLTWSGIAVVVLSSIMFVAARPLMHLVSPGFDQQTMDIAVRLMRILLLSPVFLGLGIAAKGILEAQNQFTLPARVLPPPVQHWVPGPNTCHSKSLQLPSL